MLDAKDDVDAARRVRDVFVRAADAPQLQPHAYVVVSVPPKPNQWDRFSEVRPALATALGARDGADCLEMLHEVDNYKGLNSDQRAAANAGRWRADGVSGERVLLIDDVYTSGESRRSCARAGVRRCDLSVTERCETCA